MKYYSLILLFFLISCNHYDEGEFMDYISPKGGYFVECEKVYELAKSENKPVLFHFTGYGVVGYKGMERVIFSKKVVKKYMLDNFIVVNLVVDDKSKLPEYLVKKSNYKDRIIKTVGSWNGEFQADLTDNNSQPYFAVVNDKGELIATTSYTSRKGDFVYFLQSSIKKYKVQ